MLESDADRQAYLDAFGDAVSVRGRKFQAIVDLDYQGFSAEGLDFESGSAALMCRTVDVVDLRKDDVIVGLDSPYRVLRLEPDISGMTRVVLRL